MNAKEAAEALNGKEYGEEGSKDLFAEMKASGLVAVFGASDDLIEFRGAIDDEVGAYDGGTAYLTSEGLFQPRCDNDSCPYDRDAKREAAEIEAFWDDGSGFSWRYQTAIPHEKFVINEDGAPYCEGIVFALADVG